MVQSRKVNGQASAGAGPLAPRKRWSAGRKRDVVLRLLRGESLVALSREVGVEIYRLEEWQERAVAGLELGLQNRQGEPVAEALATAKRHIGELSMEVELLRERARAAEQRLPLAMRRSRRCAPRPPRPRGDGTGSSGCVTPGSAHARRSTPGGPVSGRGRRAGSPLGGGRRPRCRTRRDWRRSTLISIAHRSRARAIGRSTRGCGSWTASGSRAPGCSGSCESTGCSPRIAAATARPRSTTGRSSPKPRT